MTTISLAHAKLAEKLWNA